MATGATPNSHGCKCSATSQATKPISSVSQPISRGAAVSHDCAITRLTQTRLAISV
jgi:hypothetical protein